MAERKYKVRSEVDVDWTTTPRIAGIVREKRKLPEKAGGRMVLIVETPDALYRVYESYDLEEAFKLATKGDHFDCQYLGTVSLDGGKTLRKYNVQLYTE